MTWEVQIRHQENIIHQDGNATLEEAMKGVVESQTLEIFKTSPDEAVTGLI